MKTKQDAIDLIAAEEIAEGQYIYYAEEVNGWYVVSEDDIETLVEHMNDHTYKHDAYSCWCAMSEGKAYKTEARAMRAIRG